MVTKKDAPTTPAPKQSSESRRRGDKAKGLAGILARGLHSLGRAILDFIDNRAVVRRVAFFWAAWLFTDVVYWAETFADNHPEMDGLKMAAMLGAVVTPVAGTFAAVFKFYTNSMEPTPMVSYQQTTYRDLPPVPPPEVRR